MTLKPKRSNLRRWIGLLILFVSLCLLLWGFWPMQDRQQTLPVAPEEMSLPAGSGFLSLGDFQFEPGGNSVMECLRAVEVGEGRGRRL